MIDGKSVLVLIPARGGSKRLPGKNIKVLGDKPLIAWSIRCAQEIVGIDRILVSTDDVQIANVAMDYGASVPWFRPAELATDTASSNDVALHALERCRAVGETYDVLVLLQPTSPFRSSALVLSAIKRCIAQGGASIVGFIRAQTHPWWCFSLDESSIARPFVERADTSLRSQDLPAAYEISGAIYVIGVAQFETNKSFFSPNPHAIVSGESMDSIDIDDEGDWFTAERILLKR